MIPEINLLPEKDRQSERSTLLFFIVFIVWFLLVGFMTFHYFQAKSDLKLFQSRTESLTLEKQLLESEMNNESTGMGLADAVRYAEKLTVPTSKVINELLHLLPNEESYLNQYSYSTGQVTVQAQFESLDMVAAYVEKLNTSKYFSDVKVDNISTSSLEESEEENDEKRFEEMPRYDVSLSIAVYLPALLPTGGEADE
ncbi:PilN domain-containing protein [Bacillus andreraoultii]|uniref:PilN domain-containing protein n=1 Tax=Bacillus andreraoultii TaxID=1499685 RepID=UPI00053A7E8B|nr:PilN domain-containing protein [Bacillus andreraoultii]